MSAAGVRRLRLLDRLALAQREGFWVRETRRSGSGTPRVVWDLPGDPFLVLASAAAVRRMTDGLIAEQVAQLREAGWTWADLGLALGVTGDAVRQRFGDSDGASTPRARGREA